MFNKSCLAVFAALLLSLSVAFAADKIDLNSASMQELQSLNGVGPATASAIIKYRESKGSFSNVDELSNVKGIGDKKLQNLSDQVTVSSE